MSKGYKKIKPEDNPKPFIEGNKAAEKWTKEEAIKIMNQILHNSIKDNKILCLQDAYLSVNMMNSTFYYLLDKFDVLGNYKKDIQDIIISRINKQALKGQFNAASSIWRMKQLGEKEKSEQDINLNGTGSIDLSTWLEKEDE